ncbi:MAG: CHASE3 domain-containing protein [Holophaga sp.]|nr:CHASE3 domain-containing protein [Holophaga sp.]
MSFLSWRDAQTAFAHRQATSESLLHLEQALSLLKDAETGQRGYLLTGDRRYLRPYLDSRHQFQAEYDAVAAFFRDNPAVGAILRQLGPLVAEKLDEMGKTIQSMEQGKGQQGLARMRTGQGKELMDSIRELHERLGILISAQARQADLQALARSRRSLWAMTLVTGLAFAGIAFFMMRAGRFEGELVERGCLLESEVLQRTEAEGDARRLNLELLASNHELEAFAYSVAHDLRAPLRHVDGFAGLLRKGLPPEMPAKSLHQLDVIQESAQRMGALIDDLLSYSRLGRTELHKVPVPLGVLLDQVRLDLTEDVTRRNVEWRISPLPTVVGDPTLLRVVLQNLLANALKFTRQRDPAIIEVGSRVEEGISLSVRDNGTGFDMRFKDKLFQPFQRLHAQEDFEGTGIGLATVARVAARHGGRAWAEGVPDQGAEFFLFIP